VLVSVLLAAQYRCVPVNSNVKGHDTRHHPGEQMSFVRNLISRLLPGSSSSEFKIAEGASARLLQLLEGPARLYAFDFKTIPLKPEIQPMLGFLAAASDVFAHDAGGRLGGPGSINATLRVYQTLFDDRQTEALMESRSSSTATQPRALKLAASLEFHSPRPCFAEMWILRR
jgi:hypothetical protein